VEHLTRQAQNIALRRGLQVQRRFLLHQPAVPMDPFLTGQVEEAIRKAGCPPHRMVSGAGHDAMILAEKVPAAMVFLRTPGGISHDPAESVSMDDVAKAIECGLHLLQQLSSSPKFQTRTCRA
jgi:allantoate deiminase